MLFQQFLPPDHLKDYVRYYWTLESTDGDGDAGRRTFRTIADGCPGLIFQQAEHELLRNHPHGLWPRLFLYGQTIQPGEVQAEGTFRLLGVFFHPSALRSIFGLSAHELTDACTDPDLLTPTPAPCLSEQLLNTRSVTDQLALLSAYLFTRIRQSEVAIDPGIGYSLTQIINSQGHISLQGLQEELGISERSFQRKFKQCVGIPPKLFSRICRFQGSLAQLRSRRYDKLSDVALEHDYADQSHYNRAFKEFVGVCPHQYQQRANEAVENFPEIKPRR